MAAPTFVAASAIGDSTAGSFSITVPSHATDDILLVLSWYRASATVATPSGYTEAATALRNSTRYYVHWKRATSGAEGAPLFDYTGTDDGFGLMAVYRGARPTGDPYDVLGTFASGTLAAAVLNGITTLTADSLVVALIGGEDNVSTAITMTATDPAAFTEHYVESATGTDGAVAIGEGSRATAGATGDVAALWDGLPVGWGGWVLALVPPPPPPPPLEDAYSDAVIALSPTAYWRLGESAGTTAVAVVGPDGTYVASPTLGVAGALAVGSDTAVTFDGSTEYITVPDDAALDLGDGPLTIALWWKRGAAVDQMLIGKRPNALYIYYDSTTTRLDAGAPTAGSGVESSVTIADSNWHFIVVTKSNADVWKLYIDGVDRTGTNAAISTASNATALVIGSDAGTGLFVNGSLDEPALFASVLTPTNVSDLYATATSAGVTVTPGVASLTLAAFAPTVSTPRLVVPTTATLTLTAFAPVIRLTVTPTTAALTLTTFAPTVTATAHQLVTPGVASLVTATFVPTVSTPRLVVPTTASLVLTTFAPTVSTPRLAVPTTAALILTTFAPTVTAIAHVTVTPTTAALTLTTFAPTVTAGAGVTVTPTTVSLTLATFAPTVTTTAHVTVTPTTAALILTTFAPTVTGGAGLTVVPTTASLTLTTFAPTVTTSAHVTVVPGLATLSLTAFVPTVLTPRLVVPGVAALVTATFAPLVGVSDHKLVTPGLVTLALGTFAPTVTASGGVLIISPPGTRIFEVGVARTNGMAEELNDWPVIVEVK